METKADAGGRSRRDTSHKKLARLSALEKLKRVRSGNAVERLEVKEEENVYELVDEEEYSSIIQKRQEDDWIVDDGGQSYVEDGREIFDEDYEEEEDDGPVTKKHKPLTSVKAASKPSVKSGIKSFFAPQPQKKEVKKEVNLDEDDILNQLIAEIPKTQANGDTQLRMGQLAPRPLKRKVINSNPFSQSQPAKIHTVKEDLSVSDAAMAVFEEFDNVDANPEADEPKPSSSKDEEKNAPTHLVQRNVQQPITSVNIKDLEYFEDSSGKNVRFFWFDACEGWTPGTVYLFGKIHVPKRKVFVSCCVVVKDIEKRLYVLPRKTWKNNPAKEVKFEDVHEEFNRVVATKYKIHSFRAKKVTKKYSFGKAGVPTESTYMEVLCPPSNHTIPADLDGETFSCIFGTNQPYLEQLILDLKLKGPGWLKIKEPAMSGPPVTWCKVELSVNNYMKQLSFFENETFMPPLTMMSLKMKTFHNATTRQNEIIAISLVVNNEFFMESGTYLEKDQDCICMVAKPSNSSGLNFPYDFNQPKTAQMYKNGKLHIMNSEREMLNFFMARFFQLDPDLLIGHDIHQFEIDLLISRLLHFKYGQWSKLGRLRRDALGNKTKEKIPVTAGRVVCDMKVSAKELIRLRNYELTELVAEILKKSRFEIEQKMLPAFYEATPKLLRLLNFLHMDCEFVLKIMKELSIIPLAYQITKIAGNIFSRTLLGGRAERNEYLLLHAFRERNYIPPDKSYYKKFEETEADTQMADEVDSKEATKKTGNSSARRKPAYLGGLVLEPKVGFYDQFILLMDFNSLYPSIIQEFNICFTTIAIKSDDDDNVPNTPNEDAPQGVLPVEIRKLVDSRREVKKLMCKSDLAPDIRMQYDVKQKALKLTANSMYGCLGFKNSRFYAKPLAALITMKGREILMSTKGLVEKMGLEVIYGDTDSIMINTNCSDFGKCHEVGRLVQREVNSLYKLLEIEIDGVFRRMLLLKKKKYAALTINGTSHGEPKYNKEVKGLDIVRRDWSILAKKAGENVLESILNLEIPPEQVVENIHNYLKSLGESIKNNEFPVDHYVITKQLIKNPEDYGDKKGLSHVAVALACNASGKLEKKFRGGDTVPFVICLKQDSDDGFNQLPATQRAFHPDELKDNASLLIDTKYYLKQQVFPVVSRLCDPFEDTSRSTLAEFLGLEEYVEHDKNREAMMHIEAITKQDPFRFDSCTSAYFHCPSRTCENMIEVRETFNSAKKEANEGLVLNLSKCAECNTDFSGDTFGISLSNQLRLQMRELVSKYYNAYMTCDDPTCSYKTRCFPLSVSRKGPSCPECNEGTLAFDITDVQLYMQFMFFDSIFNLNDAIKNLENPTEEAMKSFEPYQPLYSRFSQVVNEFKSNLAYRKVDLGYIFHKQYFSSLIKRE